TIEGLEIDPMSAALAGARDLTVKSAVWARYDLVTISHVLEHVRDPQSLIMTARQHLTPSGLLFAEVPHVPRTVWNWKWIYQTELPHCWYFEPEGFVKLFARAGYRIEAVECEDQVIRVLATLPRLAMMDIDPWEGRHATTAS